MSWASRPLTAPNVPTGIKTGVGMMACAVCTAPKRALQRLLVLRNSKRRGLDSISIAF